MSDMVFMSFSFPKIIDLWVLRQYTFTRKKELKLPFLHPPTELSVHWVDDLGNWNYTFVARKNVNNSNEWKNWDFWLSLLKSQECWDWVLIRYTKFRVGLRSDRHLEPVQYIESNEYAF